MRKYVTVFNREVHLGLLAMLCVIVLLSSALATVYFTKTIDHQATIISDGKIQTYSDPSCMQILNSHDWGEFNVSSGDDTEILDFYLRNEGNVEIYVTWRASGFTSYNEAAIQFETSSWILYLVKVETGETRLNPENATVPDKIHLSPGEVVHLKFYLTAIENSAAESFAFQTTFSSQDN